MGLYTAILEPPGEGKNKRGPVVSIADYSDVRKDKLVHNSNQVEHHTSSLTNLVHYLTH